MTPTPHDALVRAIFGQPHYAAEELRAVLPREILGELRLETLTLVEGSFIDEGLRPSGADLLFTVTLRDGGAGFVYLLFEHQSTLDERMPLRLLLHHGPRPWPWKPRFSSVLAVDARSLAAFGPLLLGFDFVLDDLARQTDAQILDRAMDAIARLALVALRCSRSRPRLFEHVANVMQRLDSELRGPAGIPSLARLARHVLEVDDSPPEVVRSAIAAAVSREFRSSVMSTADMLRAEGRLEARRESLLELLEVKFGSLRPAFRARVEQASLEQSTAWMRRVVVVSTLEEVFAA